VHSQMELGSKSKPFVCSSLKPASKSRQDKIPHTFNVAKCDRIFDYMLQDKQIKLPSGTVPVRFKPIQRFQTNLNQF
jgi:hypothetical protein